jgi:hypothetical protein
MTSNNYNILDIQLLNKKKYIVLFSGLEFSPIEKIVNDLGKDFNAIVLNYLHLGIDENIDLEPLNTRVNDLITKNKNSPQPFFIISKSFPSNKLKIPVDLHINISLNKFAIINLDPGKRADLPDLYVKSLQSNHINKYINFKKDYILDEIINDIFNLIIDDIEKKVYGEKYDKLSHKFYNNNSNSSNKELSNSSKLVFDPKSITQSEKKEIATKNAELEIRNSIDESEESNSYEKEIDDLDEDDILEKEVRLFGSK